MSTYDRRLFGARSREIRRPIRRSSPALVYSGPLGIALIAPLRNGTRWRIGKIMDRMAIVSRGDPLAGRLIHKIAAAEAYSIAAQVSRGDVLGEEPALAVATALQQRNERYTLGPGLPVEGCFVQLNATPADDYLAYLSVEGHVQTFSTVWFMGEISDSAERISSMREAEQILEFNDNLAGLLSPYERLAELMDALGDTDRMPTPVRDLVRSPRLDVVVLDRPAFARGSYKQVFHRLTP